MILIFYKDDPETIIRIGIMAWRNRHKQRKPYDKNINKELMPVVWHQIRWWDRCLSEDEKKRIVAIFSAKKLV